jgi:rhodanese-related sulfurtransferase
MTGVKEMVAAAKSGIENLTPAELAEELASGDAVAVDIREPSETADGIIPGAVLAPRGMLEFHADPESPYHLHEFERDRRVILYCAAGSRSALGARAMRELGYRDLAHLEGGFNAWLHEGRPIEPRNPAIGPRDGRDGRD